MMNFDEAEKEGFVYYNKDFIFDSPRKYNLKYVFKYSIVSLLDYIYRFWLLLYRPEENEHKYEVSICAIFKNEAPFLKEWLDYHIMIGVDHFYLYNNSEDNYSDVLSDYIIEGKVTLTEWPVVPGQIPSYKHWYENYRNETHWVSFLDLDEFICPRYNNNLKAWIGKYAKYPIVMIYWKMFGTSGKIEHDFNQLVTEQYTNSWPKLTDIGKLFYNTLYDISDFNLGMMHSLCVRLNGINIPPINIFGKFVRNGIHRTSNKEYDIQINHYWSKAYNSYKQKHERGDAAFGVSPRNFEYFLWHEQRNTSVDQNIFRFVIMLKLKKLIGGGCPKTPNQ